MPNRVKSAFAFKDQSATSQFKIGPEIFVSMKNGSFDSKYSIGNQIGEGAYGKVCIVVHKSSGF